MSASLSSLATVAVVWVSRVLAQTALPEDISGIPWTVLAPAGAAVVSAGYVFVRTLRHDTNWGALLSAQREENERKDAKIARLEAELTMAKDALRDADEAAFRRREGELQMQIATLQQRLDEMKGNEPWPLT